MFFDEGREPFDKRLQTRACGLVNELSLGIEQLARAPHDHSSARPVRGSEGAEHRKPRRLGEQRVIWPGRRAHDDDGHVSEYPGYVGRRTRESQSMAFFATPGIELLYSGVAINSPSAEVILSLSACTAFGTPVDASRSPSYSGMPRIDSIAIVVPAGASSAAARNSMALNDPRRKLPENPMMVCTFGTCEGQVRIR